MTGLYAHHHGLITNFIDLRTDFTCIAHDFRRAGYKTGYVGKWHLYFPDNQDAKFVPPGKARLGFDDYWASRNDGHNYYQWEYFHDAPEAIRGSQYQPFQQVDLATQFIEKHPEDPWCLFLSWGPPHNPYQPPQEFDHYQDMPLRENILPGASQEWATKSLPQYYGLIESLDVALGKLLKKLDDLGQRENTIVIYTSDHGDMLASHGFTGKLMPFDESILVPFLIRWPNHIPQNQVSDMLLGTPDLYPTLCGLAGVPVTAKVDGKDLSQGFLNPQGFQGPDQAYIAMAYCDNPIGWPGWRGIRTKQYTYVELHQKPWLLYDSEKDPLQKSNLVADSKFSDLQKTLAARLLKTMREVRDSWEERCTPEQSHRFLSSKVRNSQTLGGMEALVQPVLKS
jgi:arylsulfatase A-like enzyme